MRKKNLKKKLCLHPVMTYIIMIFGVIILSGILHLFNVSSNYNVLNASKMDYTLTNEAINNLFSLRGVKYIFSNTVSNFANFTVLSNLIIVLIGIGVMEYTGFLKVSIGLLTRKAKKNTITFVISLICILSSLIGNMPFLAFIPLTALIFKYGKRNPNLGIIVSFAALTCGYGLSILYTSIDSQLSSLSVLSSSILLPNYSIGSFAFILIMIISVVVLSFIITYITEEFIVLKLPKYEFEETEVFNASELAKPHLKGLVLAGVGSAIYLLIIIYNIIPGLPLSGNFLNYSETIYIDKLFGPNSFFNQGFVFIITLLFIIWGLLYGIGAKTIKNNRDFTYSLGYSLNGIGRVLVLVFFSSLFISIVKQTNIGNVITAFWASTISGSSFSGFALVVLFFIGTFISTIFLPGSLAKWNIFAYSVVPTFINSGISPAFCQIVFRFAETSALCLTPMCAFFVVYLAYLDKYNQDEAHFSLFSSIKYLIPYSVASVVCFLVIILLFYLIGLPLGVGASVMI